MASPNKDPEKTPERDEHAMMAWGTLIGIAAGVIAGLFLGHWIIWSIFLGVGGMTIGAIMDRSRR